MAGRWSCTQRESRAASNPAAPIWLTSCDHLCPPVISLAGAARDFPTVAGKQLLP
jgi:hypothetical protein